MSNLELHAHHIVPINSGGTHKRSNLKTLCKDCHNSIHNDLSAPTADNKNISSKNNLESCQNPPESLNQFKKCPICEQKKDFRIATRHEDGLKTAVATCSNCKTEISVDDTSIMPSLKVIKSELNIEGYEFAPIILKRIEQQEIESLDELDKYRRISNNYKSNLKTTAVVSISIILIFVSIGIFSGDLLLQAVSFVLVISTIIAGFATLRHLQSEVERA